MKYLKIDVNKEIVLHTLRDEYAQELFELVDCNTAHLMPYLANIPDKTKDVGDSLAFIQSRVYDSLYGKEFPFAIFYQGEIAGVGGYVRGDEVNKEIEIGYWLGAEYCGKGIMTKTVISLIDYAFAHTDVETLKIECEQSNAASIKIPVNLGFRYDRKEKGALLYGKESIKVVYLLSRVDYFS